MSSEKSQIYKTDQNSLKKAIELFSNVKKEGKRKKCDGDENNLQKYQQYCSPIISNSSKKSNLTALAFSPSFALIEMRSCLMRHDWISLQRLFPLLLELPNDKETIIWRYAFTILLHSPISSAVHLEEFLNLCVGCQNDNLSCVLEQLITLNSLKKS
ncbi:uncharacterized protein LOC131669608 [Phymastichus coffea]|uniref:uncharacterized protein LOC131669608 n=1 Tax=Phymastichus coffea TaxID=108790 RepID=UPI00273C6C44|nr:uncharacterized protein LOC131669608 [Phymastichus coffea]